MSIPFKVDLSGKTVVVTGGGGVLCSSFCFALAECGANVAVLDLKKESADVIADRIKADGGIAIGVAANVLSKDSLVEAKKIVLDTFGNIDILINGAGGNSPKAQTTKEYLYPDDLENGIKDITTFFDLDPSGVEFVFNLNFLGTLLPTQVFASEMYGREGATVINISSMNAFRPLTKIPAYSAAKSAVSNFTMWLAVHFSKVNIRVNAIAPGFFVTAQNKGLLFDDNGNPTARTDKILAATPMGRFGEPEELIGTLLYLVNSKASGFVNGIIIPVDGGFSAYSGV
ncbi:MAG: D-mannonate oxidoreductase [Clostridiales bacterium GWF2_36_10]|nr:MAG: D-mannonate oxidoreductase [Clostridiales bacterium GWF2_36_10]HAN21012.1 D-mannonate oxidoreductase [Clostridiales bacterium]